VAHETGCPSVQILKEYLTYEDLEKWMAYFYRRKQEREKQDWYLASIAHIVACTIGQSKTKIEDHLLKFSNETPAPNPDASKAMWLKALGIKEI
jgi:hypothetical protein